MAEIEFVLPDVGEGLEEGEVVSWLVAPGDRVSRDQPLVEVQTDKALVELPSPVAGQVVSVAFSPGDIVKVGQVLVILDDGQGGTDPVAEADPTAAPAARRVSTPGVPAPAGPSADFPDVEDLTPAAAPAAASRPADAALTADTVPARVAAPASAASAPAGTGRAAVAGRPKAAPAVRKLALDRGVDLATVTGTGPGGRILASDVEAAAAPSATGVPEFQAPEPENAGSAAPAAGVPEFQAPEPENARSATPATGVAVFRPSELRSADTGTGAQAGAAGGLGWMDTGRHPLRGIRRVTAEAMTRSWSEIPHLTTMDEVDATGLLAARRRLADAGIETTIGALLVAAVARGLRRYPVLNASLELAPPPGAPLPEPPGAPPGRATPTGTPSPQPASAASAGPTAGGAIVIHAECNIGLAVATPDGLVVPVIRQADRRSLADLGAEVRRLTDAARQRRQEVADLRGGTFTISNYGALGGRFATPLIRPPEVGIMGFGAIRSRPFAVDGAVKARPTLPWSLSADHRLIDGDVATAFAEYVTGLLADPVALLAELLATGTPRISGT